jgi:ADP-ribose pyrophosphatase YjhB (NUDIX family)
MAAQQYPEPTVGALIFDPAGRLLLIRSHKWRGKYAVPGGHVELGERLVDALAREAREETGLDVRDPEFLCFQEFIYDDEYWQPRHFLFFDGKKPESPAACGGRERPHRRSLRHQAGRAGFFLGISRANRRRTLPARRGLAFGSPTACGREIHFACRTDTTVVQLNDEAEDYVWVPPEQALDLPLEPYTVVAVREYLGRTRSS